MRTIIKNLKWLSSSIILGIIIGGGLISVKAWTEPTVAPPGGNIGAPINTSGVGQSKAGGLVLNTGGATNGLVVQSGNVGIGDATPDNGLKLDVEGKVGATEYCDQNGNNCKAVTAMGGGGLAGYEIKMNQGSCGITAGCHVSVDAVCSTGKVILGGGCRGGSMSASYPSGNNKWHCYGAVRSGDEYTSYDGFPADYKLDVFAICANP